ncbi:hypothetical protein TNCV_4138981 [Trichonephila clavipes]|nr:hypothetical protein TNCV_4138981 [Trichonephila clavipes]
MGKFPHKYSLEGAGNGATSELTREKFQQADSRRGGRRSGAEKKSDENNGRVGTHHLLLTRDALVTLNTIEKIKCHQFY